MLLINSDVNVRAAIFNRAQAVSSVRYARFIEATESITPERASVERWAEIFKTYPPRNKKEAELQPRLDRLIARWLAV